MQSGENVQKTGIALVGLGKYSSGQLAPALLETKNCFLSGIVTGSPEKAREWRNKYDIPEKNVYNYENFDSICENPDIDVVYIVLPNAMHKEFVIRAAKAGKHVICEKPLGLTVEECDEMISACRDAGVLLSVGYRLHFEPFNQEVMRIGTKKVYGPPKKIIARHGLGEVDGWRLDKQLAGGGPLMDLGIYCVQAARYATGLEPLSVTAREEKKTNPDKFRSVEEAMSWEMEFSNDIVARCFCSYNQEVNMLRVETEGGWIEIQHAFEYNGLSGQTHEGELDFPQVNQQANQIDDFALCVKTQKPTPVPGEMGRKDVRILQAIYESAATGKRVVIAENETDRDAT